MRFSFVVTVEGFLGDDGMTGWSLLRFGEALQWLSLQMHLRNQRSGSRKSIQVIQSDLFSGPNWRSLLDSTSFRLTWYRMEKTNWSDCFNLWVRAFIQPSQKGSQRLARDFFLFFLSHTQKTIFFLGKMDEKKTVENVSLSLPPKKTEINFLKKKMSPKNVWNGTGIARRISGFSKGSFKGEMMEISRSIWHNFLGPLVLYTKKIHGPLQFTSN